ncbi:MAG: flagellar protein FlaG [Armatimonadota bacterium]
MSAISIPIEGTPNLSVTRIPEVPIPEPAPAPSDAPAAPQQPVVLEQNNIQASFEYDHHLQAIIITLRREATGEFIQQIPSEKMLHILAGIMESVGKILDAKG